MTENQVVAAMEKRMASGVIFSAAQLWRPFEAFTPKADRIADRLIQKWRTKGLLKHQRTGRYIYWVLTEAGRNAFAVASVEHQLAVALKAARELVCTSRGENVESTLARVDAALLRAGVNPES